MIDDLRWSSSAATWLVRFCYPARESVGAVFDKRSKTLRMEVGLSRFGTSRATLSWTTVVPEPKAEVASAAYDDVLQ